VYSEVGTALPLNGGAYNALLNTTSKATAALAACLTILSYIATAVVSASEACSYLNLVWDAFPYVWGTLGVLLFFALLNLIGTQKNPRFSKKHYVAVEIEFSNIFFSIFRGEIIFRNY
jgi:amino acid transporter